MRFTWFKTRKSMALANGKLKAEITRLKEENEQLRDDLAMMAADVTKAREEKQVYADKLMQIGKVVENWKNGLKNPAGVPNAGTRY